MSDTPTPQTPSSSTPNAYLRTRVMTSSPEQLRLMLLEGAVRFARQGRDALLAKDHEGIYTGFSRARDIVVELMTAIRPDTETELKSNVQGLYTFIFKLLVDASFDKDADKAEQAAKLLEYEVETWRLAMQRLTQDRATPGLALAGGPAAPSAERPALSLQA